MPVLATECILVFCRAHLHTRAQTIPHLLQSSAELPGCKHFFAGSQASALGVVLCSAVRLEQNCMNYQHSTLLFLLLILHIKLFMRDVLRAVLAHYGVSGWGFDMQMVRHLGRSETYLCTPDHNMSPKYFFFFSHLWKGKDPCRYFLNVLEEKG